MGKESSKAKQGKSKRSTPKLAVVIMAAGKGTRLKSRRPKVLHEVGGKPLLSHVIAAASRLAESEDIYAVIGHEAARVREAMAGTGVQFIEQKEQRGTGHAIQCARKAISGYEHILVLSGDVPLIQAGDLAAPHDTASGRRRCDDDSDRGACGSNRLRTNCLAIRPIGRKWKRSWSRRL